MQFYAPNKQATLDSYKKIMLKFIFFSLLLVNAGLLAWHQGYLNDLIASEREPARLSNQLRAEQIKLVSSASAQAMLNAAGQENGEKNNENTTPSTTVSSVPEKKPEALLCTEIGNFLLADAKRFETQLSVLALGDRQSRINVQEIASHMVYIPSQSNKEGADKKATELKQLGITNFYIMQDNSPLKWGISLGIFKTDAAAQNHLANLIAKGVRTAKIGTRSQTTNKVAFQLRNIDLDAKGKLEKIKAGFPNQDFRQCTK